MSWEIVNAHLVAKALGELSYEQILKPDQVGENQYFLKLQSGVEYTFAAWKGIWDHLRVTPTSIKKVGVTEISAGQFFIDAQLDLGMTDIVLSNFIEEMNNSLYSDMFIWEKQKGVTVLEMSEWTGEKIQTILSGHPKILLSKGRVGWGARELSSYAPENEPGFQLHWLAVKKGLPQVSIATSTTTEALLQESLDDGELARFSDYLQKINLNLKDYHYLPVHPWQWDRFIKIQYQAMLNRQEMISLGTFGDEYTPQISIRTLSNISRPLQVDIKLSLSILNTSAIRGIPSRYIGVGLQLSSYILKLCQEDELLKTLQSDVQSEVAGMSVGHCDYSQIKNSPYRYQEFLGAVWRENTRSKLQISEKAILTASLFFQDQNGNSLIGAYIKKSKMSPAEWLKEYFKVVVIPLYHLQLKYGIGLVAHGQNIVLRMQNFRPYGVVLKDFQGDLRLADNSILLSKDEFKDVASKLDQLPAHYLIHDLMTGHLVTVLRFVSEVMEESDGLKEIQFYQILSEVIREYHKKYSAPLELSLLNETISRVLVNKVRFKIGYGDSSERPKPMVGEDLGNPIHLGLKYGEEQNG